LNLTEKQSYKPFLLTGVYEGRQVDNTTDEEIDAWLGHLDKIKPSLVMIYPIARETPVAGLEVVPPQKLAEIAQRLNSWVSPQKFTRLNKSPPKELNGKH
jgi:hypothetical protein